MRAGSPALGKDAGELAGVGPLGVPVTDDALAAVVNAEGIVDFSIASCALTGNQLVEIAEKTNKHGTRFRYRQFPQWLMKMISFFSEEVVYPLRYAQWYNDQTNGYDFACNADLADLEKIHPLWTFEKKLESWGITEIKPARE